MPRAASARRLGLPGVRRRAGRLHDSGEAQRAREARERARHQPCAHHVLSPHACAADRGFRGGVQIHRRGAVAERLDVVQAQRVRDRQHGVGHRRAVGGLHVQAALEGAAAVAGEDQRAALVVVHVRVAHRRAVEEHRVLEQVGLAVLGVLQLLQEVGNHARRGTC